MVIASVSIPVEDPRSGETRLLPLTSYMSTSEGPKMSPAKGCSESLATAGSGGLRPGRWLQIRWRAETTASPSVGIGSGMKQTYQFPSRWHQQSCDQELPCLLSSQHLPTKLHHTSCFVISALQQLSWEVKECFLSHEEMELSESKGFTRIWTRCLGPAMAICELRRPTQAEFTETLSPASSTRRKKSAPQWAPHSLHRKETLNYLLLINLEVVKCVITLHWQAQG